MADVLKVQLAARVKLLKNSGVVLYDQSFAPAASDYDEHSGQALEISAGGSATLSKGGITTVHNLLLQSDTKVTIKVNSQATGIPLVGTAIVYAAFSCSLHTIIVTNNSATDTATVQYICTD